jgi:hypothetical protein
MARYKARSPRPRHTRPKVRATACTPAYSFELPILLNTDHESPPALRSGAASSLLDGRNPLEDQSTESLPTTTPTTQITNSLANLDDQSQTSLILTPTSPEASQSGHGGSTTHTTAGIVGPTGRERVRCQFRANEQTLPSIDESLAFRDRWVPDQIDAVQGGVFVNTGPISEQQAGPGHSPWSGLNRIPNNRHNNPPPRPDVNRGGRRGGLGKEKAAKVGGMRLTRACLRCFVYRIECDGHRPCAQCQRRMRTWNLGCTRQRLPERLEILLPGMLCSTSVTFRHIHSW